MVSSAFDFGDASVRGAWSALLPAVAVFIIFCVSVIPRPTPLTPFISLHEAEAIAVERVDQVPKQRPRPSLLVFVFLGLLETLAWLTSGLFYFVSSSLPDSWSLLQSLLIALSWLYTTVRPIVAPFATAPYDLFAVYLLHLVGAVLLLGGYLFDYATLQDDASLPAKSVVLALGVNLAAVLVLLYCTVRMPMNLPSAGVQAEDIGRTVSPEDYTTLLGWLTFSWVYPLIQRGTRGILNETDVWHLSPTMQSRVVFAKFQTLKYKTLLRRLVAATSLDMIVDLLGGLLAILFQYAGPFFLKLILDTIDTPRPTPRATGAAYAYAGLMFLCGVLKGQCDLQHLWFARRATTQVRSALMSAVYDKTLRRKEFSGIVRADKEKGAEGDDDKRAAKAGEDKKKEEEKKKAQEEEAGKAGADVGKIQNLMSNDADDIAFIVSTLYFITTAPFELILGSVFLYQLLGWSAFAGFLFFFACWPLNSYLTSRDFRIKKAKAQVKDRRVGVLDELISSIKFIKFFAWEERWIDRAMDARNEELGWMVKEFTNNVIFAVLWSLAPISLSVISFFTYIWLGNELTAGTAFTAIALFAMIRAPLNTVPTYIMYIINSRVALTRIANYLEEDEVTPQVSSLKQAEEVQKQQQHPTDAVDEGLGIENASFEWNRIDTGSGDAAVQGKGSSTPQSSATSSSLTDVSTIAEADAENETGAEGQDHRFELRDISVKFPEGRLSVITGPTASGKTALLMALMGEMTILPTGGRIVMSKNDNVDAHGHTHGIAYAAQTPWLRHQSIRDNILFGSPFDEARYNQVVECCALKPDFEMLEDGDTTEIGIKGVSLSGGQKARVALARAVYSRKKYVLLDDPLSAVDSHTSRFLFEKCLQGPLLAHRTVILVTHHVELVLPGAYYVVRMLDGRIDTLGTVEELRAQGVLDEIAHEAAVEVQKEELAAAETAASDSVVDTEAVEGQAETKKPRKLVEDERRETGSVKWAIYREYLKASGYYIWSFLALLVVFQQFRSVGEKIWIKIWSAAYGTSLRFLFRSASPQSVNFETFFVANNSPPPQWIFQSTSLPSAHAKPMFYVGVYTAIMCSGVVFHLMSAILQYIGALRASRNLFKRLLVTVVRATFRFHDTTPQGRILNRFSKDFATVDSRLAGSLQVVNQSLAGFFASILTVTAVFPAFLVPASIVGYNYWRLAVGYLNTGRDLRRMESNTRSPIFSDFGELLTGVVTVRAFSAERSFLDSMYARIDATTTLWYNTWMTNRWLLINYDVLGSTSVFITALFAIAFLHDDAGLAGLAITSALSFSDSVYWASRFWAALELDLNSVERIVEYMDLPQEPPAVIESNRPPAYWPSSAGNNSLIVVDRLNVKYAPDLPSVLQDVSFELKAGERVGLVGRTGSGKSTLAMSLLRFVDPSSGRILIDGIDISKIGIHDLRSRLTFIPQDATLFSGSLRDNLDPFGDYEDSACLDVLLRVNLITQSDLESRSTSRRTSPQSSRPASIHADDASDTVSTTTNVETKTKLSLSTQVSAGGANFSQGQRQLIAMARALLRRSSIVVMDEATSSVDFATDSKIQTAIRAEFTDSLLITVAHRLRTIIDYDRLLVLDKGKVVEFDTPFRLMQKEDGIFRNMCLKSGSFGELEAAAKAKETLYV